MSLLPCSPASVSTKFARSSNTPPAVPPSTLSAILFDQSVPVPLRDAFVGHEVWTAYERGWSTLKNGDLLNAAEGDGIEVMLTTDSNLLHQQNLDARSIAVVCLRSTSWPRIRLVIAAIVNASASRQMIERMPRALASAIQASTTHFGKGRSAPANSRVVASRRDDL
jgi:hypothetical protein